MVSEKMAPGPSNTQRIEEVEVNLEGMKNNIEELQQQLSSQFTTLTTKMTEEYGKLRRSFENRGKSPIRDESGYHSGNRPSPPPKNGQGGSNWHFRKLNMPLFDGTNPDAWILRAERYFQFYGLQEKEKIEAAVLVALEGDTLLWYQWEHRRRPIRDWEDLKTVVLRQFNQ